MCSPTCRLGSETKDGAQEICKVTKQDRQFCGSTKGDYKKVTHVIFDLDGLLLDTESVYRRVHADVISGYGKQYTIEIGMKVMGTREEDGARVYIKELDLPCTVQELVSKFQQEAYKVLADSKLMPGAEDLVKHLHSHNIPLAVATSSSTDSYNLKTQKLKDFFSLFHHITCGGSDPDVKQGKPSPDVFLVCARKFPDSPKPEDCLVFEDAPNGVLAAKAAGMQVVMVPDKLTDPELCKPATLKLNSLAEVQPELFGLPPRQ